MADFKLGEFLAKALEAEERAACAENQEIKELWLKVAAGYRDLVRTHRQSDDT